MIDGPGNPRFVNSSLTFDDNKGQAVNYGGDLAWWFNLGKAFQIAPLAGAGWSSFKVDSVRVPMAGPTGYDGSFDPANLIGPGSIAVERTPGQEIPAGQGTATDNLPIPRQGFVEECTATVVFLASERASYITGQTYMVNGGAHFL